MAEPSMNDGPPNQRAWLLAAPIVVGGGMLLAGAGFLLVSRTTSGQASGAPIAITFESDCAKPAINARLADFGLPSSWSGAVLTTQLPGSPGDGALPESLARRGQLKMLVNGVDSGLNVVNGGVQVSLQGGAVSLFTLDGNLPELGVVVSLDGEPLEIESINGNELQISARGVTSTDALRIATDRVVQVRYPLPCDTRVVFSERR